MYVLSPLTLSLPGPDRQLLLCLLNSGRFAVWSVFSLFSLFTYFYYSSIYSRWPFYFHDPPLCSVLPGPVSSPFCCLLRRCSSSCLLPRLAGVQQRKTCAPCETKLHIQLVHLYAFCDPLNHGGPAASFMSESHRNLLLRLLQRIVGGFSTCVLNSPKLHDRPARKSMLTVVSLFLLGSPVLLVPIAGHNESHGSHGSKKIGLTRSSIRPCPRRREKARLRIMT